MKEIWKTISIHETNVDVSSIGRIRSVERVADTKTPTGIPCKRTYKSKILAIQCASNGYSRVGISIGGKLKISSVHRLVAIAFLPNPNKLQQVNHIDGNKSNNHVENLEWCTASINQIHAIKNGLVQIKRGTDRAFAKLTDNDVIEIRKHIDKRTPYTEISKMFGICRSKITFIKQRKSWSHVK